MEQSPPTAPQNNQQSKTIQFK